jgi:hypothetical protein
MRRRAARRQRPVGDLMAELRGEPAILLSKSARRRAAAYGLELDPLTDVRAGIGLRVHRRPIPLSRLNQDVDVFERTCALSGSKPTG